MGKYKIFTMMLVLALLVVPIFSVAFASASTTNQRVFTENTYTYKTYTWTKDPELKNPSYWNLFVAEWNVIASDVDSLIWHRLAQDPYNYAKIIPGYKVYLSLDLSRGELTYATFSTLWTRIAVMKQGGDVWSEKAPRYNPLFDIMSSDVTDVHYEITIPRYSSGGATMWGVLSDLWFRIYNVKAFINRRYITVSSAVVCIDIYYDANGAHTLVPDGVSENFRYEFRNNTWDFTYSIKLTDETRNAGYYKKVGNTYYVNVLKIFNRFREKAKASISLSFTSAKLYETWNDVEANIFPLNFAYYLFPLFSRVYMECSYFKLTYTLRVPYTPPPIPTPPPTIII